MEFRSALALKGTIAMQGAWRGAFNRVSQCSGPDRYNCDAGCLALCRNRYRWKATKMEQKPSGRITKTDEASLMNGTNRQSLQQSSSRQQSSEKPGVGATNVKVDPKADSFTVHSVVWGETEVTPTYSVKHNVMYERQ